MISFDWGNGRTKRLAREVSRSFRGVGKAREAWELASRAFLMRLVIINKIRSR